MIGNTNNR